MKSICLLTAVGVVIGSTALLSARRRSLLPNQARPARCAEISKSRSQAGRRGSPSRSRGPERREWCTCMHKNVSNNGG